MLPGRQILLRQLRFVAPDEFWADGEHDGVSGAARLAMNVILLIKSSKIIYILPAMANFGG